MADVNQQLIAERLKISRATVSRCFTNHPGINPVTRARVFQLAAEIGYTHLESRTARSLTKKKAATTFGLLISSDEEEYHRTDYQSPGEQILAGVTECAQLNSTHIDVHLIPPAAQDLGHPSYLRIEKFRRKWSGMLLVYPFPTQILKPLSLLMPTVSLVEQFEPTGIDWVDVDHHKGISSAIEHLIELGHRRIGFFTRRYEVEASWSFRRYAAFVEKMVRERVPVDPRDVVNVFPAPELGIEAGHDHVAARTRDGVTAWVCAADHQAYDLIRSLTQRGISVPGDVSVTGFDGIATPAGCPTLGTVHIPFREIGATGTRRLVERVRRRFGSSQRVLVDCPFKPGASIAAPPIR
jgi:LacI family transcriptional regulator